MKRIIILLCSFALAISSFATDENSNIINVLTVNGTARITLCSPTMFRVQLSRNGTFPQNEKWMVMKYEFPEVTHRVNHFKESSLILTDSLTIRVYKRPFRISVSSASGNNLYEESGHQWSADTVMTTTVKMNETEHFFGFGERMDNLDQRGKLIRLDVGLGNGVKPAVGGKDILRANYCPVPLMMSTMGYGIFFHNPYATSWDMGWSNKDCYSFSAVNGDLDYYFIYGPTFYNMLDSYTELTGRAPMLPKFAFGLHLGTYSGGTWKNEQCTSDRYPVELCKRMRAEGVPFDILWLDSTWRTFCKLHGNGGCCFEWRDTFKNPKGMFDSCYAQHVAMVGLHIRSYLDNGPKYHLLDAAKKQGHVLYQDKDIVDFFNPKAADWWFKNAVMKVASIGCKFVKTDVGGTMATPALHNIYTLAYTEAPFLRFKQYNNMRGLTHTREGFAGIQRYPYIWAGDWGSEWQWFEPLIVAGMNIGMSGVGNWTHCMGGFEQYSAYDTELYMRWCQFGMFSPIAMVFGMDHPRYHEPWTYGKEALANFIKYDSLRYRLIPYIYTSEYHNHVSGRPLMSPLLMDYQHDENTYRLTRQYMFGPSMMVCPVTTKGALSQTVYFPGGTWYDYDTGEKIEGRQYKSFLTPTDVLPIFIKAGAIIPQQPAMQYYGEKPVDFITLDIYPSGHSIYELYDDDGVSEDYTKGVYALTHIESEANATDWQLSISRPIGKFTPSVYGYKIKATLEKKPTHITENDIILQELSSLQDVQSTAGWYYDATKSKLHIHASTNNRSAIIIKAECTKTDNRESDRK